MSEILKKIKERRSIREFLKKEIPKEIIDKLIEALIWAPSAGNLQSRKFFFVFNEKIKEKLKIAALNQSFILQAPLVIVACADLEKISFYGERGKNLYAICDVAASIENLMILATDFGLGTCWVGAFDEREVSKILNLPKNLKPLALIPVGFPAKIPSPPERMSKKEAVEFIE